MLVFRPERYVGDFKGLRIIIRSDSTTQDGEAFERTCEEFKKLWDLKKA